MAVTIIVTVDTVSISYIGKTAGYKNGEKRSKWGSDLITTQ